MRFVALSALVQMWVIDLCYTEYMMCCAPLVLLLVFIAYILHCIFVDLTRRTCDKVEKDFIMEKGAVTETQRDLGKINVLSFEFLR